MIAWYCGTWAWIKPSNGDVGRFYCGLARCDRDHCKKMYWLKRVRLISALIPKYHLDKFFTLTMDRSMSKDECWEKISYVWNKCRTGLKRDYPNFKYISILEAHKDGYPHIHGFTDLWMSTKEWSRRFSNCGGGKIAWVEKVKSGDISEYVSKQFNVVKYVGKAQVITAKEHLKSRQRSMWRSKGLKADFELSTENGEWKLDKGSFFIDSKKGVDNLYEVRYNKNTGYYLYFVPLPYSEEELCLIRKLNPKRSN